MTDRVIAHVDMDAFYASVEIRDDPSLQGRPVVVGGSSQGRGVVAAASYVARRFGVHSAMPMRQAEKLCPNLVRVPPNFGKYQEVSRRIMEIFHQFSPLVEPLSLDEAFLDLTGTRRALGEPREVARRIKERVRTQTQLTASIGVAPVKFVAKIASDLQKPDGLVVVDPGQVEEFLGPLPISRLWGVGPRTCEVLKSLGIHTVGQLASRDSRLLEARFGAGGQHLHDLAHGRDPRGVIPEEEAKSYSHEETFAVDKVDGEFLEGVLLSQSVRVARRLRADGVVGRIIQLKLRDHTFHTQTRRQTLASPTSAVDRIFTSARSLFRSSWRGEPIRLIGVGVSGMTREGTETLDLFTSPTRVRRTRQLFEAIDHLEDRYGEGKVTPARLVGESPRPTENLTSLRPRAGEPGPSSAARPEEPSRAAGSPRGLLLSEALTPIPGTFDPGPMAQGAPSLPAGFSWRGRTYKCDRTLRLWKQLRPEPSGQEYVRRHYYQVRMEGGEIWTVYCLRQAASARRPRERWFLYKLDPVVGKDA